MSLLSFLREDSKCNRKQKLPVIYKSLISKYFKKTALNIGYVKQNKCSLLLLVGKELM